MGKGERPRTPHVAREAREAAGARLQALRESEEFRSHHVRLVAESLGVLDRTVWRWLQVAGAERRSTRRQRAQLEATAQDVVDLAYHRGNVSAFQRARRKEGPTPGIGAWRRAFARALSPGQRAGLASGERARRDLDTYLIREPEFRNACWEADHTQLAIKVILPDRRVVSPWATIFIDVYSRAITG